MNEEFKKLSQGDVTRYVLESATSIGSSSIASMPMPVGGTRKRGDNLITQEADKKTEPPKIRNPVAKNASAAIGGGAAGAHKDKSKTIPRKEKHKKPYMEALQARLDQLKSNVAEGLLDRFINTNNTKDKKISIGDYTLEIQTKNDKLFVYVTTAGEDAFDVAEAEFNIKLNNHGKKYLESEFTKVYPKYQRKGIATMIYRYVKSLGYDVQPSSTQTDSGKSMWKGFRDKGVAEGFNGEYDDEAGMAQSNLLTTARAVMGLLKTIKDRDNLPEWGQEKIAKAEMMLVSVWDYLQSQKAMGNDPQQGVAEGSLNELSKDTLKSYSNERGATIHADQRDAGGARTMAADKKKHGDTRAAADWDDEASWLDKRAEKGAKGVAQATTKIAKKGMEEDDSALNAFLSKGGKIQQLPYKKPRKADKTDYGSKHIGGGGDKMKASRTGTAAKTQGSKVVGVAEGLNEFAMSGGDDGEDPFDNYPCYDCGSTIFLHHTELCDLAEPNAKHDLPARPGSQHWTGEIPKGLNPIPGLQEGEANYDSAWDDIKKFGKKAAVAGAIGLGIGAANAGSWSPTDVPAGGHNQLPDIVAHVKFKVGDKLIDKEINLGSHYRSPGEAGKDLENFLKSKGIKFYEYSLERVKPTNNNLDSSPAVGTGDEKHSIDTKEPSSNGKNTGDYMAKEDADTYFESLQSMMERQLEPTMDLDTWVDNFQNADPNKYHQFKNKTPEKKK